MRTVPILALPLLASLAACTRTIHDYEPRAASLSPADAARAGANAARLNAALANLERPAGYASADLLSTMPDADLASLPPDLLEENGRYAVRAWRESPWGARITEPLFKQYLLPYASLNERRDNWRKDFFDRFHSKAWSSDNPLDAAKWLNSDFKGTFGVEFHATKRPKPDQSPYESIQAHYASCTGMSILLTDACRAVGVPARIVGVPKWKGIEGNHNWVEVWGPVKQPGGTVWSWHAVGEAGGDPRDLNWVHDRCREATDPDIPESMVYAAVHRPHPPEGRSFPLVWDESYTWVPALNITRFYKTPAAVDYTPPAGVANYSIEWRGETIAIVEGGGPVKLPLAKGESFWVVWGENRSAILRP